VKSGIGWCCRLSDQLDGVKTKHQMVSEKKNKQAMETLRGKFGRIFFVFNPI
jgi:hypothetical protein